MENQSKGQNRSYLSFHLDSELFALPVSCVHKILELVPITEIPRSPDYMKGVINLRGKVLPVIDTRVKFGMAPGVKTKTTCLLVIEATVEEQTITVCLMVDSVQAVLKIKDDDILPPPSLGNRYKSDFILGMTRIKEKFVMILNIDKTISSDELIDINQLENLKEAVSKQEVT